MSLTNDHQSRSFHFTTTDSPDPTQPPDLPDNYVSHTLKSIKALPPVGWHNWWNEIYVLHLAVLTLTPAIAFYGALTTTLRWQTALFSVFYYFYTGLGITAGYHRLWSHRSYNASKPFEYFLAIAGAGAVQGSIKWWCRSHRAHHRYTDTDLDPYGAHHGLIWSHVGWIVVKPRRKHGTVDVSDLSKSEVVRWQHRWFLYLIVLMGIVVPTVIPGLGWGDWRGGYVYAAVMRLLFVHHSTYCVNSLAHWLGDTPFDDKHTPRDHLFTALVTIGEGYHNFHHQFPMDYRNAIKWYQYDPTKWFIWFCCEVLGLGSHLKVFPDNEVRKGQLTMELKKLRRRQDAVVWPVEGCELPVISWETYTRQAKTRPLVAVAGFIHDVASFLDEHPGGRHLLARKIGKDATSAFFGGVYDHSNAAHNLLAMKRVGVLLGGQPHGTEELAQAVPPSQKLRVTRFDEVGGSTTSGNGSAVSAASASESDWNGNWNGAILEEEEGESEI